MSGDTGGMLRIRSIGPAELPSAGADVAEVQRLLRSAFTGLRDEEVDGLAHQWCDSLSWDMIPRSLLFAARRGETQLRCKFRRGPATQRRAKAVRDHAPNE